MRWSRPIDHLGALRVRGCAKTRRNFANDRAEQIFRDFFVSERSESSKKRTKRIRLKAGWSFYTASVGFARRRTDRYLREPDGWSR